MSSLMDSSPIPLELPRVVFGGEESAEERLRGVDMAAFYDSTVQGSQFLMSMTRRRIEAGGGPPPREYWGIWRRRVIAERRALPFGDMVGILAQRDRWNSEMEFLDRSEPLEEHDE